MIVANVPLQAYASEQSQINSNDINTIQLSGNEKINDYYDEVEDTDVVIMPGNTYEKQDIDDMKEILDNGTDILVTKCDLDKINDDFDIDLQIQNSQNNEKNYVDCACVVKSNGESYDTDIISAGLMNEDGNELTDAEIENGLNYIKNIKLDVKEVYNDIQKVEDIDKLSNLEDDTVAKLQTDTLLGKAFCENDKFVYFYKYGDVNGTGTTYSYSSASSKPDWVKLGSLIMDIYAIKVNTLGNSTYDEIYSVVTASGLNSKFVRKYNVSMDVNEVAENRIIDFTTPDGGSDESISASIGTEVNSSGDVTASSSQTYTYNPNGQTITPICGEKYVKTWKCKTASDKKNKSWTIKPAILLKKTNGKTTPAHSTVYVDYFQLSGGVRTYTQTDTVSCIVQFKNHASY